MKTELTITRYNAAAIIGWANIVLGLVAAALQYLSPTLPGIYFMVIGLSGGAIMVTFAGPLKTITTKRVTLREIDNNQDGK